MTDSLPPADAALARASDLYRGGHLPAAMETLESMLAVDPHDAEALHLLGVVADAGGDPGRGAELIGQALAIRDVPRFRCNLGMVLCHLGRHGPAAEQLRTALAQRPDYPEALNNLGVALDGLRQSTGAEAAYRAAIAARSGYAEAWSNLGTILRRLGRLDDAVAAFETAVALGAGSNERDSRINLAQTLQQLGRFEAAIGVCERALAAWPNDPGVLNALGNALRHLGRYAAAEHALRRALALTPNSVANHNNLAIILQDLDRPEEALELFEEAERLAPGDAETRHHRAMLLLRDGRLVEGWRDYEARSGISQAGDAFRQFYGRARWTGESLEGRTILLMAEQGLGDTIQFARYVPWVAKRGGRILLGVPRELLGLLGSLQAAVTLVAFGDPLPPYDVWCPLMSLPLICGTTLATVPAAIPYLAADPAAVARWAARLGGGARGLRVGLVWAGNPAHLSDRLRSIPFAALAPLWRVAGLRWFSLQVGPRAADLPEDGIIDLAPELSDFAATAAAIAALDLVIAVDTSVAHLAGALGRPVWLLLARVPDWRWLREGAASPWYPTMRLFRQDDGRDWAPVIRRVAGELAALARGRPAANSEKLILFDWGVSSYFGWGVYGLNLLLAWADRPELQAASLQPIDPAQLDLDPLERRALEPSLRRSAQVQDGLRALAGQRVTSANLVMHCLGNGLARGAAPHGVEVRGTPEIGVAFIENTRFPPDAAERLRDFELVVAGSSWNRTLLQDAGARRVELVLQGVDPSAFHVAPRRGLFSGRFVVFSGGKLEYRKGQDLVVQAFRIFAERHPDALLLAAWSSPWPDFAATLAANPAIVPPALGADGQIDVVAWAAANGIAGHQVIDLGRVANRALPRILREADIALLPSRAEGGTNLVAMECMACGVPAILSANTGHLDLIGDGRCLPLARQAPVPGDSHRCWGTSSVEEILAVLESVYTSPSAAAAVGQRGAAFMSGLSWRTRMDALGGLLLKVILRGN